VPAVALTAYARSEDGERARSAGFQMHATKPIDPQELISVVRTLATGE
jgi:CheY-like chemotaxis protein